MRILRDITREKEIDTLKSKFISTASHQLRTPLAGLRWALNLLGSGEEGVLNPQQHDLVRKTSDVVSNLNKLLDELLTISRAEEEGLTYNFEKCDLAPLVKKIIADMSIPIKEHDLSVSLAAPEQPLPSVNVDPVIISMAIRNVIDNAIRYSLPKGAIRVSLGAADQNVMLSVKDSGIGILGEDQKFIFSKFFRAKNAQLYQTEGSGLGLYLVKKIIERHNGRITFESKKGEGSEFYIYLPIADPKASQ